MRRMSFKLLIPTAVLSALLMLNPSAFAVGLGSVEVETRLNEPLRAVIPLMSAGGLDTGELEVSLASPEEFERVGIDRPAVLTQLNFEVAGGDQGPVVRVTSEEAISEPFLSFLVRVSWPQGRLLREYTVLLDPPVTAPATAPRQEQAPSQAVRRGEDDAPAATSPSEPAEPAAGEGRTRGTADEREPAGQSGGGRYGPVAPGETLWNIAESARPDSSISVNQMMLALLRTNPDAFFRDNINALRQGAVLRVPDRQEIQRVSTAEAIAAVQSQHDLWQDLRRELAEEAPSVVAGGESQERAPVDEPPEDESSRLELVPPREGEAESGAAAAGPDEGNARAEAEELREELSRTREELLARSAESDQQGERVDELENQVDRLQRLLELKNEELAAIQAQSDEAGDAGGDEGAGQMDFNDPEPGAEDPAPDEFGFDEAGTDEGDGDAAPAGLEPEETAADEAPDTDSDTPESAEDAAEEPEESEAAAPPPAPPGGGWMELLLSPVVLGIAGLLLIGIGVALFLHRRGGGQPQSTVQRESLGPRTTRRETAAPGEPEESSAEPEESEFGPPESGPADYDEAALRAALEENPDDTDTRLKLIRHYAAVGRREAFVVQAETLYADLADPASPAWLETRELGEEIAPDHELFGGSAGDVRSAASRDGDESVSAPGMEPGDQHEPMGAGSRPPASEPEPGRGTEESEAGDDLPDLDFETPASEEPAREEAPPHAEPPADAGKRDEEEGFDLSGLGLGEDETGSADDRADHRADHTGDDAAPEPEEKVSDDAFDFGETAGTRESDEQEPLEFDLSDFETEAREGESAPGESEDEDWMTQPSREAEGPETPETSGEEPDTGAEPDTGGGEAAPGAGGEAVDTKLELAEAYMDMSDEEGAREMLEEVLSEGDEGQQKRAREMLDKLS